MILLLNYAHYELKNSIWNFVTEIRKFSNHSPEKKTSIGKEVGVAVGVCCSVGMSPSLFHVLLSNIHIPMDMNMERGSWLTCSPPLLIKKCTSESGKSANPLSHHLSF